MTLPWLKVSKGSAIRSRQTNGFAAPLTNSYPVGTFYVTAANGAPLAPGQPANLTRAYNTGTQQTGDPRATGGYWQIIPSSSIQKFLMGGSPGAKTTNYGGNIYNAASGPSGDYSMWIIAAVVIGVFYALFKGGL
jgi:hypothetical protein